MELSERQAKLNTELRFQNYRQALPLALALRLELELIANRSEKQVEQLKSVDLTIRQLERANRPAYVRLSEYLWHRWVAPVEGFDLPPLSLHQEALSSLASEEKNR